MTGEDITLTLIRARQDMQRAALRVCLSQVGGRGSTDDLWWRELAEAGRKLADAQDAMDFYVEQLKKEGNFGG